VATVRKTMEEESQAEKVKLMTMGSSSNPAQEKIAARAYEIWLASGRPMGQDKAHWLQAERELKSGKPVRH